MWNTAPTVVLDLQRDELGSQRPLGGGAIYTDVDVREEREWCSCELAATPEASWDDIFGTFLRPFQVLVPDENTRLTLKHSYTDGVFHSPVLLPATHIVAFVEFWSTTLKTRRHQSQIFQLCSGWQGLTRTSTYQKYRRCWALSGVFVPRFHVHSMVIML